MTSGSGAGLRIRGLARDSLWALGGDLALKLSALGIIVILTRALDKEEFGQYGLGVSIVAFLSIAALPGAAGAIVQSVARGYPGSYRSVTRLALRTTAVGILFGFAVGIALVAVFDQSTVGRLIIVASAGLPATHGLIMWESPLAGTRRFREQAKFRLLTGILRLGAVAAMVVLTDVDAVLAFGAMTVGSIVANLVPTVVHLRSIPRDAPSEGGIERFALQTSIWLAINRVANHLDKVLIFAVVSPTGLAIYVAADRVAELTKTMLQTVVGVLVPRFAVTDRLEPSTERRLRFVSLIAGAGLIVLSVSVLPFAFPAAFTSEYDGGIIYAQLLTISLALSIHATVMFSYIRSKRDNVGFRDVTATSSVVRIALVLILVPTFGLGGAVAATVAYRIAIVVLTNRSLRPHREALT